MKETAQYNPELKTFLEEIGLKVYQYEDQIMVDRTNMVQKYSLSGKDEHHGYETALEIIKEYMAHTYPEKNFWIVWSGRTDEWLGLAVYDKESK